MDFLLLLSCGRALPPALDEPAYLAELQAQRPDLVVQHQGSVRDPAWQALVIRPRFRAELLAGNDRTYETIVAREYTDAERASDASWAQSLRDAELAFDPTDRVARGGYDTRAYASYRQGDAARDADGFDYKAFFELADFHTSLSAARYAGFAERLGAVGFRGDSKIDLRPGAVRFEYNDVIVHAPSIDLARCAEAVGIAWFGAAIEHIARGVDPPPAGKPLDWHHFLLTGGFGQLPAAVRDFVQYRTPVAGIEICPEPGG
jgi:hypothetical protein